MLLPLLFMLHLSSHLRQLPPTVVPAAVRQAWSSRYSAAGAGAGTWTNAPDHTYEVSFSVRGARMVMRYTATGRLVETRSVIGSFNLPDPVRQAVMRLFKGYHILETWRADPAVSGAAQYVVEADNISTGVIARFDAQGDVISQTTHPVHHHPGESAH